MELIAENVSAVAARFGVAPEVITTYLTDPTKAADVKPFADSLGTGHFFTDTQLAERLGNERRQAADAKLGETYGAVDRRVKEATGVEKNAGETTLDYQERAFRQKFSTATGSEELTRVQGDLQAARDLLATKDTEFNTYKASVEKQASKARVASDFDAAVPGLNLADAAQADYVRFKFNEKFSSKTTEHGIEYTDKATGVVQRNTTTAGLATAADLLKTFAPTIPGVSFKQPSASQPSGYKPAATIATKDGKATMNYDGLNSVDDFHKAIARQGVTAGSAEATDLYAGFKAARPDLFQAK